MRVVQQLGREDWIAAGLEVLASQGWAALRVEPVARRLGVSKGSFYWHFPDRAAWLQAVLDLWEHRAFAHLARARRGPVAWPAGMAALTGAVADWASHDLAAARAMARLRREGPLPAQGALRGVA